MLTLPVWPMLVGRFKEKNPYFLGLFKLSKIIVRWRELTIIWYQCGTLSLRSEIWTFILSSFSLIKKEKKDNSRNKHLLKLVNLGSVNKELLRKKTFLYWTYSTDLIFIACKEYSKEERPKCLEKRASGKYDEMLCGIKTTVILQFFLTSRFWEGTRCPRFSTTWKNLPVYTELNVTVNNTCQTYGHPTTECFQICHKFLRLFSRSILQKLVWLIWSCLIAIYMFRCLRGTLVVSKTFRCSFCVSPETVSYPDGSRRNFEDMNCSGSFIRRLKRTLCLYIKISRDLFWKYHYVLSSVKKSISVNRRKSPEKLRIS